MDDEIEICWPYLEAQIKILNPKVIVTLGRHSLKRFLPGFSISAAHGEPKRRQSDGRIIFPMYHPAVALYKASSLAILEKDFMKLSEMLMKIREGTIQYMSHDNATLQQFSTEVKPSKNTQNLTLF
jgi:DNA polymerase